MSTATAADGRSETADLARLSPIVLLAVPMPYLLQYGVPPVVSRFAPAYEPLVTGQLADFFLYPVVTGTLVLAGLYALLDPSTRRSVFLFRWPTRRELLAAVGAGLVAYLLGLLIRVVAFTVFDGSGGGGSGGGLGLAWIVAFVVVSGVFAPVVEEVLFRGLLLGYLVERGVPTVAAAAVVAAAFGAIHFYNGPVAVVATTVIGAIAVAIRLRYENLAPAVVFHATVNQMTALYLLLVVG